jgi:hypothetical protein
MFTLKKIRFKNKLIFLIFEGYDSFKNRTTPRLNKITQSKLKIFFLEKK